MEPSRRWQWSLAGVLLLLVTASLGWIGGRSSGIASGAASGHKTLGLMSVGGTNEVNPHAAILKQIADTSDKSGTKLPVQTAIPASAQTVSGTVSLAPALAKEVKPDDTVFIFARPTQGSRMPLAMLRKQVRDLPLQFVLDDNTAMSPQTRLSQAGQVIVVARITKSASAAPLNGDLAGRSVPVPVGSHGLTLEIAEIVKE
jgi:hypothetical protein